ncbi:MAG: type II toxin-antitoxin system VapC family toxin [Deltaproteobacteria bacterium]|nr:type II toxin-antitoxin system VapC family toxin [Deltaproteobacteria bacterium]
MPLLLDTCVLLWMAADPNRISKLAREQLIQNQDNLCVSAISAFEIAIKHKKKKLELPMDPWEWFEQTTAFFGIKENPISAKIAALSTAVEVSHSDPCDRIIIATALTNNLIILSPDHMIQSCRQVEVLW